MQYEYKTVPAPGVLEIKRERDAEEAIRGFADLINEEACDGWEFYCTDSIITSRSLGLFGGDPEETIYKMLIFRRLVDE